MKTHIVEIRSDVDRSYVEIALHRSGYFGSIGDIRTEKIKKGVTRIYVDNLGVLILKKISWNRNSWWNELTGNTAGEFFIFNSGVFSKIPSPFISPYLDCALNTKYNELWILMKDFSANKITHSADLEIIAKFLARLHSRFWQSDEIKDLPLCDYEGLLEAYVRPFVSWISETETHPRWVRTLQASDSYNKYKNWTDFSDARDVEFYMHLWNNKDSLISKISEFPKTLIHGDFYDDNYVILRDHSISVFDWSFSAVMPGPIDLGHFDLLRFWSGSKKLLSAIQAEEESRIFYRIYRENLLDSIQNKITLGEMDDLYKICWLINFLKWAPRLFTSNDYGEDQYFHIKSIYRTIFDKASEFSNKI